MSKLSNITLDKNFVKEAYLTSIGNRWFHETFYTFFKKFSLNHEKQTKQNWEFDGFVYVYNLSWRKYYYIYPAKIVLKLTKNAKFKFCKSKHHHVKTNLIMEKSPSLLEF